VEVDITSQQVPGGVAVRILVRLSGREAGRLFISGDAFIQLPLDGALPDADGSPMPRSSIFLSELSGRRDGLTRSFAHSADAEAFAAVVRAQLDTALEAS